MFWHQISKDFILKISTNSNGFQGLKGFKEISEDSERIKKESSRLTFLRPCIRALRLPYQNVEDTVAQYHNNKEFRGCL